MQSKFLFLHIFDWNNSIFVFTLLQNEETISETNTEENHGPRTFYNRDINDTGCLSSASTIARIQQF